MQTYTCHGDSGAPLVIHNGNHYNKIIGILHGSESNCLHGYEKSSKFTNIENPAIYRFIESWLYRLDRFGYDYVLRKINDIHSKGLNTNVIGKLISISIKPPIVCICLVYSYIVNCVDVWPECSPSCRRGDGFQSKIRIEASNVVGQICTSPPSIEQRKCNDEICPPGNLPITFSIVQPTNHQSTTFRSENLGDHWFS